MDKDEFKKSHFFTEGKMSDKYLTVAGSSRGFGKEAELYSQDASILGWTCGNLAASAHDVAKFYYNLLSPDAKNKVVSAASLKTMQEWNTLDFGWAEGSI
jgi:carbohydrate-binding DOMON domain-containing protein